MAHLVALAAYSILFLAWVLDFISILPTLLWLFVAVEVNDRYGVQIEGDLQALAQRAQAGELLTPTVVARSKQLLLQARPLGYALQKHMDTARSALAVVATSINGSLAAPTRARIATITDNGRGALTHCRAAFQLLWTVGESVAALFKVAERLLAFCLNHDAAVAILAVARLLLVVLAYRLLRFIVRRTVGVVRFVIGTIVHVVALPAILLGWVAQQPDF